MKRKILVHTGAGDHLFIDERTKACEAAANHGFEILKKHDDSLKAVCEAIKIMEDVPECDAGTGSGIQLDNQVRMDAAIMDSNMRCGGVIQIKDVRYPIEVARILLEKDFHIYLSGEEATKFARNYGFMHHDTKSGYGIKNYERFRPMIDNIWDYDEVLLKLKKYLVDRKGTVGAIAIDSKGTITAGTSTGGMETAYAGRVGDSAIIGAGTFAGTHAGISCSGIGEKIIRVCLAKTVYDAIKSGKSVKEACDIGINEIREIKGDGGVMAIDCNGNFGYSFNTDTFPVKNARRINKLHKSKYFYILSYTQDKY